jgi:hypothetical protein
MSASARPKRCSVSRQARKVERSFPPGSNYSPYLTGRAIKGTWVNLGRQKEKVMISIKWIASDDDKGAQLLLKQPSLPSYSSPVLVPFEDSMASLPYY